MKTYYTIIDKRMGKAIRNMEGGILHLEYKEQAEAYIQKRLKDFLHKRYTIRIVKRQDKMMACKSIQVTY